MNNNLIKATMAFEDNNLDESLRLVETIIEQQNETDFTDALLLKAKILYKQQKWGDTLNILNKILDVDPNNEQASNYKTIVQNILTFWHKDNYNP
jgi:tetratricopeptide (TPR) repeat protein